MNKLIILDVAHGKNTPGKASPDKKHQEWRWSRQLTHRLIEKTCDPGIPFNISSPYMNYEFEPGLRIRVNYYNQICKGYDEVVTLSLHNNAAPENLFDNTGWADGIRGIEFWTSRGETKADKYATIIYNEFRKYMPGEKYRTSFYDPKEKTKDPDKEKNFTIIAGYYKDKAKKIWVPVKYHGILLEIGFMTSHQDVANLNDDKWLEKLDDTLIKCMDKIYRYENN